MEENNFNNSGLNNQDNMQVNNITQSQNNYQQNNIQQNPINYQQNNIQQNPNNYQQVNVQQGASIEQQNINAQQNYTQQYNNLNTNDKNAIFGTSQDGRIIASARKIKGELIGGYILFNIPLRILFAIISLILLLPMTQAKSYATSVMEMIAASKRILIVGIPISILGVAISLLAVFFSSKITFKKRKVRKVDVSNVLKAVIIFNIILACITLFNTIRNYTSNISDLNAISEKLEALNTYNNYYSSTTSQTLQTMTEEYSKGIEELKGYYYVDLFISLIADIAAIVGCIFLQKKLLNKNSE